VRVPPQSARELADCAGLPADRLYCHLGQLERAGLIEIAEYRPLARGKVERIYAPAVTERPRDAATPEEMAEFLGSILDATRAHIGAAYRSKQAGDLPVQADRHRREVDLHRPRALRQPVENPVPVRPGDSGCRAAHDLQGPPSSALPSAFAGAGRAVSSSLCPDPFVDALDGVEEVLEGVEIAMLFSDLAGCHVPVLKFSFTAAPDDDHGDAVIPFERHPGAGLGSAIHG
jgi:hypothetical protein